jgi:putative heme-binding domain-containing protein
MNRLLLGFVCVASIVFVPAIFSADADQEKINTAVEALTRLENVNLDEKPAIKAAVERVLEKTRGTPNYVKLVRHFNLKDRNANLLEVAINNPENESGVEAMRLVLASKNLAPVQHAIETTNVANAVRVVQALGNAKEKQAVSLLAPLVTDEKRNIEVRRAAVRALAQTQDGANALLSLAKAGKLPDNLKFIAASELSSVRWPEIQTQAKNLLPLPAGRNAQPLPPVSELVKMKGEPNRGAEVFRRETVGCIKCHQVRNEGRDVGPALTEIGSKLAKEAIYEAVLDPSAGISFGFEAWQVELKNGDEAYGLKASETPDEVAIKDTNGIVTRYKRSEIASMKQMKTSIMPAGLQQTMTTQELVDLVEYLASLKKTGP